MTKKVRVYTDYYIFDTEEKTEEEVLKEAIDIFDNDIETFGWPLDTYAEIVEMTEEEKKQWE